MLIGHICLQGILRQNRDATSFELERSTMMTLRQPRKAVAQLASPIWNCFAPKAVESRDEGRQRIR
jgi:hypothetical protein